MPERLEAPGSEFARVLRAAIRERGLGLERIRDRLRAQGISVSLATLSYWQSGRSRPERRDSLAAVELLESVLELSRPGRCASRSVRRVGGGVG